LRLLLRILLLWVLLRRSTLNRAAGEQNGSQYSA